ncbi:MAG: PQQ-dependent sugar dehydrogenase [Cyclobacteriaceae bacterium]
MNQRPILALSFYVLCISLWACQPESSVQQSPNLLEPPPANRFTKTVLIEDLEEPMEIEVTRNHRVFFVERKGQVKLYNPATGTADLIGEIAVFSGNNDGLLGLALDPDFYENQLIYFYYSPAGDEPKQRLSRIKLVDNQLDMTSEEVILEIPTQRETCCHSAGSLEFGPNGLLYVTAGDNTNPWESDGYAPLDSRPDRVGYDAQQTAGNTNDLRGKILRIRPLPYGTAGEALYEIPEGNLFPKDGSGGRPEIYVMGTRNPFRISIDPQTSYLYFGDVGPDASTASEKGPNSYDELNVVKEPGNYGWPYFIADNQGYPSRNFANDTYGEVNDPEHPLNTSANNTGARELPPARPAMLYYNYQESEAWPSLGKGGRSIMAGEVYRFHHYANTVGKFPVYYDNCLFIYEWMRNWIKVARLDEDGELVELEDFMPETNFEKPMDMQFGPDGSLYVLEYGSAWYSDNSDAKLSRISYTQGNRPPVAKVEVSTRAGAVPLEVQFSATSSYDLDSDSLTYAWQFGEEGEPVEDQETTTFTFEEAGEYPCTLVVTDTNGEQSTTHLTILAGNAPPQVAIELAGNETFYWHNQPIPYQVKVSDQEDGSLANQDIDTARVFVFWDRGIGENLSPMVTGHQEAMGAASSVLVGKKLIDENDCKNCHKPNESSIGPSYKEVAFRYQEDTTARDRLAKKVIAGGGGVWDKNFVMVGHPDLSEKAAKEMVNYILSMADEGEKSQRIATQGQVQPQQFQEDGLYRITAKYEDQGGAGVPSQTAEVFRTLRPARIQAEAFNDVKNLRIGGEVEDGDDRFIENIKHGSYAVYEDIDLTQVYSITLRYASESAGGTVTLHLDSPDGDTIGETTLAPTGSWQNWQEQTMAINPTSEKHDLYFVFKNGRRQRENLVTVDWFYFSSKGPFLSHR